MAIAIVDDLAYYQNNLVMRVMDAAIQSHPEWVIKDASQRAEAIMNASKAKYYEEAVTWLKKVCQVYLAVDRSQAWSDYRTQLVDINGRKRKLMGLM
ncbi:MAG: hypothetical protein AAGE84_27615 [Cyanobacteria bacterium P01_G01_bin.39]